MSLACIAHEVGRIKPAAMPEQRKPGFRFVTPCNVNQELIGGHRSGFHLGLLGPAYKSVRNAVDNGVLRYASHTLHGAQIHKLGKRFQK